MHFLWKFFGNFYTHLVCHNFVFSYSSGPHNYSVHHMCVSNQRHELKSRSTPLWFVLYLQFNGRQVSTTKTKSNLPTAMSGTVSCHSKLVFFLMMQMFCFRCNGDEKVAVPCEGWCHMYIQCTAGVPATKGTKCKNIFKSFFDYEKKECAFKFDVFTYCNWWTHITTTTTQVQEFSAGLNRHLLRDIYVTSLGGGGV